MRELFAGSNSAAFTAIIRKFRYGRQSNFKHAQPIRRYYFRMRQADCFVIRSGKKRTQGFGYTAKHENQI